jgi:hypothetical protein
MATAAGMAVAAGAAMAAETAVGMAVGTETASRRADLALIE